MASVEDSNALLIYQVGPVRCCAPTGPITQIVPPPQLTHPPGSDAARPGIFKYGDHIVSVIDLRQRFGIDPARWQPGRLVITALKQGYTAFWVDRIVDVISIPTEGWGGLPPHLPRDAFSRTLLHKNHIHLYTDFEQLPRLHPAGFLRDYLAHLEKQTAAADNAQSVSERPLDKPAQPPPATPAAEPARPPDKAPAEEPAPPSSPAPATTAPPSEPLRRATGESAALRTASAAPARATGRPVSEPVKQPSPSTGRGGDHGGTAAPPPAPQSPGPHRPAPRPVQSMNPPPEDSAAPQPASPTAQTSHEASADSSAWPALLFLLLLLLGGAGGSYFYLSDEEPPLLTSTPEPDPESAASPAPPGRVPQTLPDEAPALPTATGENTAPTAQAPGPAPEAEPAPEPKTEPEPAPPQPSTDTTATAPPYRASIEHDAEGITLILEEPAPPLPQETVPTPALPPSLAENPLANLDVPPEQTARAADTPSESAPEPAPAVPQKREIVHIVKRGDTLWDIAKRYVDNPWRYPELAENSEIRDPDLIYPGDRVRIIIYRGRRP